MLIVQHSCLPRQHGAWGEGFAAADERLGITGFEVRMQRLAPQGRTAVLCHGGEMVVLLQVGSGKLLLEGAPQAFQAPCSVIVPPQACFQLVNEGRQPLEMVWVYTRAPGSAAID